MIVRFVIFLFLVSATVVNGQTRQNLEKKKKNTLQEIELANKLLEETRQSKNITYKDFLIVKKRMDLRNSLIVDIEEEIEFLSNRIRENEKVIHSLEDDLKKIKSEYAKIIYYSYKSYKPYDKLMYILSASNFNEAYRRTRYIKEYTDYRKKQVKLIEAIQNVLATTIVKIEEQKNEQIRLLAAKEEEKEALAYERRRKEKMLNSLKTEEKRLLSDIREKEEIAVKLENEIKEIIAEEARKSTSKGSMYSLTPEEELIGGSFRQNKGRLPWPTQRGIITNYFGEHDHPVIRGVKIQNNGIDIATSPNAPVRTLFEGEVSKVLAILGANNTVIIRHGSFLTVYQNLINVRVKAGDKVKAKEVIGMVFTEKGNNSSTIHLEIWEELNKLNPELWIGKMD